MGARLVIGNNIKTCQIKGVIMLDSHDARQYDGPAA